jgi:ADP-L-glycero-D-manno-heptose 6-epimerase
LNKRGVKDILVIDSPEVLNGCRNLDNLQFADSLGRDTFLAHLQQDVLTDKIEGVLHMGAITDTTEKNRELLWGNNYDYTKRLAEWCVTNGKRFVYASSAATYGDGTNGFSDEHARLQELKPLNLYAESKHLFDLWALRMGYLGQIAGLKYFNVFGPNEYHKHQMRSVVHKAFEQIRRDGEVKLFKSYLPNCRDGEQMRDFVYLKDVVEMTLFVYDHRTINGIFNIGTGKARSFRDLVVAVFHAMDMEPNIEYVDMPETLRERYQYFTQADIGKLLAARYEKRIHSLEEGVEDYVKNYLLREDPYLK